MDVVGIGVDRGRDWRTTTAVKDGEEVYIYTYPCVRLCDRVSICVLNSVSPSVYIDR